MKRNLAKIVTLCAALALCLSAVLCFSLTASAEPELFLDSDVSEEVSEAAVVVEESDAVLDESDEDAVADEILFGDADGDGEVTMKDVLTIRKYIIGMEIEIDLVAADVDGDGEVTMKDVRLVCRSVCRGDKDEGECGGQGRGNRGECSEIGECGGQGRGNRGERGQGRGECGGQGNCSEAAAE